MREYAGLNLERGLNDSVPESVAVGQLRQTLEEAERFGITSIQELSAFSAPARAVSLLEAVPTEIRVRIVRMPGTTPAGRNVEEGKGMAAHPTNLITVSGEKWMVDGVGVEGTFTPRGAIKIPAALAAGCGFTNLPLTFPKEEIAAMLQESIKNNDQLLLHISGYRGAKAVLDAMDASGGEGCVGWKACSVRAWGRDFSGFVRANQARRSCGCAESFSPDGRRCAYHSASGDGVVSGRSAVEVFAGSGDSSGAWIGMGL